MQEEQQAHAKASQQQLDKHAIEVPDRQQRTPGASPTAPIPTAPTPIASITPVEHQVQVHSFTFPLPSAFYVSPNSACLILCLRFTQHTCKPSSFQLPFTDFVWANSAALVSACILHIITLSYV